MINQFICIAPIQKALSALQWDSVYITIFYNGQNDILKGTKITKIYISLHPIKINERKMIDKNISSSTLRISIIHFKEVSF